MPCVAYINDNVCATRGGSHTQFISGIGRGFLIEGKACGHERADRDYSYLMVFNSSRWVLQVTATIPAFISFESTIRESKLPAATPTQESPN